MIFFKQYQNLLERFSYNQRLFLGASQRGRGSIHRGRGTQAQGGTNHPPGVAQQAKKRTRWFVALYDYDPTTMSPNPDACEEELRFNEGDTIKVSFLSGYTY